MTDAAFADFDAAWEEEEAPPVEVKLYGRVWTLPPVMPAAPALLVARWMSEGREQDDLTNAEALVLSSTLIPAEILNQWHAKGITADRLGVVVMWALGVYMDRQRQKDSAGEAEAPEASGS